MKDLKRIGLVGFLLVFMASLVFAGGPRAKIFAKGDLQGKESAKNLSAKAKSWSSSRRVSRLAW